MTSPKPKVYRRVLGYLRPYLGIFAMALICMTLYGASDGAIPFLIKYVLDDVFAQKDSNMLIALPIALSVFAIFRAFMDFGQQYLIAKVGHNIVRDMRNELNAHLLTLPPSYFVRHSTANLLSRLTSDVILVRTLLTDSVAAVLRDCIRVVVLLAAAIYLDPTLALLAFVVFPIGVYPVLRFGKRMRKLSKRGQESIGALSTRFQESMLGNRVVKIFGRERFEQDRFQEENDRLNRTFVKSEKIRAITGPINEVLATLGISGVILYGGHSVMSGLRTQGDFLAFIISVFLLYDPFKKLSRVNGTIQQGISGAERMFELLDHKSEIEEPVQPVAMAAHNNIQFRDVYFSYGASADSHTLSGISLTIEEGKKIALVGFSGAGKSTLIDLIPRFIDPARGEIQIGGVNIKHAKLEDLRARIALVGQHTFLFNDTIYQNIAYGNPHATEESVRAAAKAAYATGFIEALPTGFETIVGEGGYSLSGGERQRIAIARAILKNAPILILDEATASLDNRAEREVQSAIEELEKGRTCVVIAHRLSTVRNADKIVVMRDGRIVESGTHDELLSKSGEYERLYALQFSAKAETENAEEVVVN